MPNDDGKKKPDEITLSFTNPDVGDPPPISDRTQTGLLSPPPKRKGRRGLLIMALFAGFVLGSAGALYAGWAWFRSYVESPKLWQDISQSAGVELTAASTQVTLFPPTLAVATLEAKREGVKLMTLRRAEASLFVPALLGLVGDLRVSLTGLQVFEQGKEQGKPKSPPAPSKPIHFPALPIRRLDLALTASDVKLPIPYVPQTDAELKGSAEVASDRLQFTIDQLRGFGLKFSGKAEMNSTGGGTFDFLFPEKESLISGKMAGSFGPTLKVKGDLKLPNTQIPIPPNAHWLASGQAVELEGSASLGGGVRFELEGAAWTADASWDLNLTHAGVTYGTYEKKNGKTALVKGRFSGSTESWKLTDLGLVLGQAKAALNVDAGAGQPMHVIGSVEPFEIAEFVPLLFKAPPPTKKPLSKEAARPPKVSGRASAKIDLQLPRETGSEPSGSVALVLENWNLDGPSLMNLAGIKQVDPMGTDEENAESAQPALDLTGKLALHGKIAANLDKGTFRDGSVRLQFDASELGVRYGELFHKRENQNLLMDVVADGSGKSLVIKTLKVLGPAGLRVSLKGVVNDLKDYSAKLQITEGRLPLDTVASLIPKAANTAGSVDLSGELQGSLKNMNSLFAKFSWALKNVGYQQEEFALKHLNGKVETVISNSSEKSDDQGEDAQIGQAYLVRFEPLSGQFTALVGEGEEAVPINITAQGSVQYKNKALSGDLTTALSQLDLRPWMKKTATAPASTPTPTPTPTEQTAPADAAGGAINFKKSHMHFNVSAPAIRTPYLDFTDARAALQIGADSAGNDFQIERVSGKALEGDLSMKAKVRLPSPQNADMRLELSATGQNLSMTALTKVVQKASGKDLQQEFFGKADIEVQGGVSKGLPSADFRGKAEIHDGGFKFLPLPKQYLDQLRQVRVIADHLPLDSGSGKITDKLEKAIMKFHLTGEKVDLDVESLDSYMAMTAKGHVTLGGHCDMKGSAVPSQKLVGPTIAQLGPVLFTSVGDNWACSPSLDLKEMATGFIKAKATEKLNEQKDKALEKVKDEGKNLLKGILGR